MYRNDKVLSQIRGKGQRFYEKKVEGARDEAKIRVNAERTRVSNKIKAKMEALDIAKARAEAKAK